MTPEQALARVEQLLNDANTASQTQVHVHVGEPTKIEVDKDGKAHAYIVIYPGSGVRDATDATLCGAYGARGWPFQATCGGGNLTRAFRALTRLQSAVVGVHLGDTAGFVRELGGPDKVMWDREIPPPRAFFPVLLAVDLGEDQPAP